MIIEDLVDKAIQGERSALEGVVAAVQDDVYHLALRMLAHPEDARDATQEIIIRVITQISTFERRSTFKTWVYRVASNYLLTNKKLLAKHRGLSFEQYREDLEADLQDPAELKHGAEYPMLLNEIRIACTLAMLLCLNQKRRLAYILGEILEMDHNEAGEVLGVSQANYRKLLSRARGEVLEFTSRSCGLVGDGAKCSCERKLKGAIRRGRVSPARMLCARHSDPAYQEIQARVKETREDLKTLALQKSVSRYACPDELGEVIEVLMKRK